MNLFSNTPFVAHSGGFFPWKIECDALHGADWATLAELVSKRFAFKEVYGVPEGGLKFALALKQYRNPTSHLTLIVDDVLTTGKSMEDEANKHEVLKTNRTGVVVFSRNPHPQSWIRPLFTLGEGWCRHG